MDQTHATPGHPHGPDMDLDDATARLSELTAPRVSEVSIKQRIASVEYFTVGPRTFCIIIMANGYDVVGSAKPFSAENFDPEVGKRFAYEDAFRKLNELEGYLLRESLYRREIADRQFDQAGMAQAATHDSGVEAPGAHGQVGA